MIEYCGIATAEYRYVDVSESFDGLNRTASRQESLNRSSSGFRWPIYEGRMGDALASKEGRAWKSAKSLG